MSDDPTVLGMINDNLNSISSDVKEIKKEMKTGAVLMENHEGRIGQLEKDRSIVRKTFVKHINNKKKHYNQGYKEGPVDKVLRKKYEYLALLIATAIIGFVADYLVGLQ